MDGVHLHVRSCICTHVFGNSGTAEQIALKFCVWLEPYLLGVLHKSCVGTSARVYLRTQFPYLGNGWADCSDMVCKNRYAKMDYGAARRRFSNFF